MKKREFFCLFFAAYTFSAVAVLTDEAPVGKQSKVFPLQDGSSLRVDVLAKNLFRVRRSANGIWTESGMNRYGFFNTNYTPIAFSCEKGVLKTSDAELSVNTQDGTLSLQSGTAHVPITPAIKDKGFDIRFGLAKGERIYGLGDASRKNIQRRGSAYDIWIANVTCYIPVPVTLSRAGWGVLLNSTWRHHWDVGMTDPDAMVCSAPEGTVDFYLFTGTDYPALLNTYTELTGRPALLPVWGYGFTFVCNQWIDQFSLINDALRFREYKMPCDVIGLEPGWMEKFYDFSTTKTWSKARFYFPYWAPKGSHTWPYALKRKGFKLSLWLCCDYDLTRYEEQLRAGKIRAEGGQPLLPEGITETWMDDRIGNPDAAEAKKTAKAPTTTFPEGMEPWFEHLKKFVDQGAQCFKLDGANQIGEHPKRKWANGMTDEEMHNLFPLVYDRQMGEGYEKYTQRRAMVYSAAGYAGLQKYVATWAGDTGGGIGSLVSMLNLAFSGHSNHSCDMTIGNVESLHFGFLQTWSQENNWDYWWQPWLMEDEKIPRFIAYANLRYRLLPYLYTAASQAAQTGWPVMRALAIAYPDNPAYDAALGEYMLGDNLLVSAFSKQLQLPPGIWHDWWTGEKIEGGREIPVKITYDVGGALLVKDGAIIPTWPVKQHLEKGWNEEVTLLVWPAASSRFDLYEDEGVSLAYRAGEYALTPITCTTQNDTVTLTVGARKGKYAGMPATRAFHAVLHRTSQPKSAILDGKEVTGEWDAEQHTFTVFLGDCGNQARTLVLQ